MKIAVVVAFILGTLAAVSVACDRNPNRSFQPEVLN